MVEQLQTSQKPRLYASCCRDRHGTTMQKWHGNTLSHTHTHKPVSKILRGAELYIDQKFNQMSCQVTDQQVNLANTASTSLHISGSSTRCRKAEGSTEFCTWRSSRETCDKTHTLPHTLANGRLDAAQCFHAGQDFTWNTEMERQLQRACGALPSHTPLTLQQLQAGAASGAHVADLFFGVPLCTAGGRVTPTWRPTHLLRIDSPALSALVSAGQWTLSPMMVTQPFLVTSTTLSIRLFVPLAKLSHSNTPTGPFHTICWARVTASA